MTRKDYVAIAAAINATQDRIRHTMPSGTEAERNAQLRGVRRTAAHVADALAQSSPRFNSTRFLEACGYGSTTMNPRDPALDLRPLPEEAL